MSLMTMTLRYTHVQVLGSKLDRGVYVTFLLRRLFEILFKRIASRKHEIHINQVQVLATKEDHHQHHQVVIISFQCTFTVDSSSQVHMAWSLRRSRERGPNVRA